MQRVKTLIVIGIEKLCDATFHVRGCTLARVSARLDERWNTGQWHPVEVDDAV